MNTIQLSTRGGVQHMLAKTVILPITNELVTETPKGNLVVLGEDPSFMDAIRIMVEASQKEAEDELFELDEFLKA